MKPLFLTAGKLLEVSLSIAISFLVFQVFPDNESTELQATGWKAGIAKVDITPSQSMWMGGYAFRSQPSEGVRQRASNAVRALMPGGSMLGELA